MEAGNLHLFSAPAIAKPTIVDYIYDLVCSEWMASIGGSLCALSLLFAHLPWQFSFQSQIPAVGFITWLRDC
jgi:hypothetical protein